MRVIFIAAECEPWAKVGGLGDVVDALARALGRLPGVLDEPVEVFLPRYREITIPPDAPLETVRVAVPDPFATYGASEVSVRSLAAEGYRLRLVDLPSAYDRAGIYGDGPTDYDDNAWRFAMLGRAALETRRAEGRPVDVLNVHDWHGCPAIIARDVLYPADPVVGGAATVLTLHNPAYRGRVPRDRAVGLGLGMAGEAIGDGWGVDLLREGIRRAELVVTVSPGYAREVLRPEHGMGVDGDLRACGDRFLGILNGIDTSAWDPATDRVLAAPYSRAHRAGKVACRADLLRRTGLDPAAPGPILGVIGRLDPQKGFDLVAGTAERLVERGARLVVLGSGDHRLVEGVRAVAAMAPDRLALVERFDRDLARRIYAGADLFLMPSRFEPCGQAQMIALRYGTPPVARRTGGLADTIVDLDEDPVAGTGFLFDDATPEALLGAVERALAVHADPDPGRWEALVDRAMAVDHAWEKGSAPAYAATFERAIALRRAR